MLPGQCSAYAYLSTYSFFVALSGSDNYIIAPLQSFALEETSNNSTNCAIYVELLDETLADSLQIVLGVGFLKSFNLMQVSSNSTVLTVNPNS